MKKLLPALLCLFSLAAFSQNVRYEGIIQDVGSHPLEMANIMAVNNETKAMDAYAITNDKGRFVLNLKANTTYTIRLSFLGMKNKEMELKTGSENISNNITMEEGGIDLQGVEVVREMPVSISGDTIVYNADSFKSGTERKLEDVLKKLPGVEVDADGGVKVEGKSVTKLMVEGKDFFDGDTKLGVKNIPADAIDKVQVLRNYNEISQLKGVENNEENVAMNIKLKSGKKNFWFGDVTAGGGVASGEEDKVDRYIANPKLFYYSPKYSINLIGNFNNIGELPLTIQDYFKFTGGFRSMMRKGGSNFNVSSNDLGISLLRNNRAKDIESRFGATNFSYNVTKAWTISGFGILSSSSNQLETVSKSTFLRDNSTQQTSEKTQQESRLALGKLSSSYKPNENFQLDYDALVKSSKQDEHTGLLQQFTSNGTSGSQTINTQKKQDPISLNQNLSLYYTHNTKNILDVEIQHLYQNEDPFYNANLQIDPFRRTGAPDSESALGLITQPSGRFDLNQERFVKTNKLDAKVDYYYLLTPKSNLNITLGNTYSYQTFNSDIFQKLDNGTTDTLNPDTYNDADYRFNDVFAGFHYKILTGKFTFSPGVTLHRFDMSNNQFGTDYTHSFSRLLPDFYALWQIKKSSTLSYNFGITNNFTDITQLAEGYVLNSYNSISQGYRQLGAATAQAHTLRYRKFNLFNQENIFANLTYTKSIDAVNRKTVLFGVNQSSEPTNLHYTDQSLSASGSYGRSFLTFYKASLSASLNWSKNNNLESDENQDYQRVVRESFSQSYTLSASTNFKELPNLEFGYTLSLNDYTGDTFYNDKPFARLDYYFLDSFSFVAEYEYNHYYNSKKTSDNEYDFLSASLIYQKKGGKFEYKISGTNLLNTTSLNDDSFNTTFIRTSQYVVQPRYVILSLKYNL